MRLLALSILFVTLISGVKATHIVGGELYYDCLGSNDYRLTVKVYRDCGPNNVNGTPFDDPLPLTIYDGANNLVRVVYIPLVTPLSIPTTTTNPCLIPPPQCIEVATYSSIENLPPTPGGYTIVYQRCCRNSSILNLTSPSSEGGTYFIKIPDPGVVTCNSSPRFSALPPLVICANDNFSFNHSATDPDGDSLVYDFYTPLQGGTASAPSPDPSSPPPYFPIAWAPGFSQNNQINGTPNLTINSSTGMLTCTPSVIGIYVYAVKVSEYRGGVLLSEALREFQINIVNCTVAITADIQPQSAVQLCSGLTLQFTNTSVNATSYYWDFGDTTTTADNSTLVNPSYTFPDTGTYYVTLVANPGTVCNDSIVVPFEVHLPLNVTFAQPDAQCVNTNSFDLLATGNFTPDATFTWTLPMSTTPLVYTNPALDITYADSGKYIATIGVTEFGCTDIYSDTLFVYPLPVIGMTYPQELACEPYTVTFSDTTLSWSPVTYAWNFGDGWTSTEASPTHTYTDTGYFDLTFTISVDTICVVTQTIFIPDGIHVHQSPDANIYVTPRRQSVFTPTIEVTNLATDIVSQVIYYMDGDSTLLDFDTHYYHDTGWYNVYQWVINAAGCTDTMVQPVYIIPETTIYIPNAFTPNGDGYNDVFLPVVRDVRQYLLMIYNRWGEVIWQTDNPLQGWDGTLNNKRTKVDTYVYKVKYMDRQYMEHVEIGHVTLVR